MLLSRLLFNFSIMSQKSITAFFKPLSTNNSASNESSLGKRKLQDDTPSKKVCGVLTVDEEIQLKKELTDIASKNAAVSNKMGLTWFKELKSEFNKPYFKELGQFIENERKERQIFPPADQVYTWTIMCPINDVKVVILGQDPYHGPRQAHGLCFSVQKGVDVPPSLKNMYAELRMCIDDFQQPNHGDLTGWAKQGVLLLNACLTVRKGEANSHANKGWENFTDAVIKWFNTHKSGVVFMLWGNYAQKKGSCIDAKRHLVLKCGHPSPLSVRHFSGCKHFSKANTYLKEKGKKEIDWSQLP